MSTSPRASEASPHRAIPHAACPSSSSCITTTLSYFSLNKRESQRECQWKAISTCSAPWLSIDSAMCRRKESRLCPSSCRTLQCDQNSDTQQCNRTWIEWGSEPAKLLSIWRPQPKQNGAKICFWSIETHTKACKKLKFSTSVSEKTNTVTPNFFLMSGIVMKQRTDTEKISQFLGRIRTGSSYFKLLIERPLLFSSLAEERENNETNDLLEKKEQKNPLHVDKSARRGGAPQAS